MNLRKHFYQQLAHKRGVRVAATAMRRAGFSLRIAIAVLNRRWPA